MFSEILTSQSDELRAVNRILSTIAAPPLNTLEDLTNVNGQLALTCLYNVSQQVQASDWAFNSFENFVFEPNTEKKIPWPKNIIRIHRRNRILVERDGYMYDQTNATDIFNSPLTVDEVVFYVNFKSLPNPIKTYVTWKAAREFQVGNFSSDRIEAYISEQEGRSLMAARDWDMSVGHYNMFENIDVMLQNDRRGGLWPWA